MWCDAALSRYVRKIFSSLWQSVGRERLLRAVSTSCLYLSTLAFFTLVRRRPGLEGVFICNILRIGRWSALSVNSVYQEHEAMRDADANETSGELGSAFGGTLVGLSQLRIPDRLIESAIFLPLVSVDLEYHDGWCALKSPRIRMSGVV